MMTIKTSAVKSMYELALEAEKSGIVDGRSCQGRIFSCSLLIMMIIVGLLHKRLTIRSQGRLYHDPNTAPKMMELFRPYFQIEKFPSTACITRFIQSCDTEALSTFLCQWAYQLVDDDGVTPRAWGADGQAARASKCWKDGGRPLYNVDYFDQTDSILVYMDAVECKSQESVILEQSVQDVLDGHPNVYLGGDAMMTKQGILEGVLNAGANSFFPLKRNNPKLMEAFCEVLEHLSSEGNDSVDHYVDLNGAADGVGNKIIRDTKTTYEEEDNKKNGDNPKSRPIRDLVFFDNIYPYAVEEGGEEASALGEESPTAASGGSASGTEQGMPCSDGSQQAEAAHGPVYEGDPLKETAPSDPGNEPVVRGEGLEEAELQRDTDPTSALLSDSEERQTAITEALEQGEPVLAAETACPGPGTGVHPSEPVLAAETADGMQGNSGLAQGCSNGNRLGEPKLDSDTKGAWVRFDDRYLVLAPSHGRLERREHELLLNTSDNDIWANIPEKLKNEWEPYINGIGIVTRYRAVPRVLPMGEGADKVMKTIYEGTATRTVYMFTDPPASAKAFSDLTRGYWDIENTLHGVVDNLLGQDKCTCRVGNSTGNMSLFRKIAFNVLSSVRNTIDKIQDREKKMPFTNILDSLSGRSDQIGKLLFGAPDKALDNYARNYGPSFD